MADIMKISPFAPDALPQMPTINGVRFAAIEAGIRYKDRKDLMLAILEPGTSVAGVTTKSKTCAAPVLWCREQLRHGKARALVVNSGNANAFTGIKGADAVSMTADAAAAAVGCAPTEVYIASTGVIGEPMDAAGFTHRLADLAKAAAPENWEDATRAIMTTDTYPKLAKTTVEIAGQTISIGGFAKGSGMIAPDMATMLSFIFTDARIDQALLQTITKNLVDTTFNSITVDSDTSTSDTVLIFATGKSAPETTITDPASATAKAFSDALHAVMLELAQMIVKDGEGLSKFVTIKVTGAEHYKAAHRIAMALANSPILKAAIGGEDPNWGRVVMAVGKAGEEANRDKLKIHFGPHLVAEEGERAPSYREEICAEYMKNREIDITVDVGISDGHATVWTCDLTHDYITINADYRS